MKLLLFLGITFMHDGQETFFTSIGCIDGRTQQPVAELGLSEFGGIYPDTITDAGLVAQLAKAQKGGDYYESIKEKLMVSINIHKSLGVIVYGHQKCAGNPVDDNQHRKDILDATQKVREMMSDRIVTVLPIYVKLYPIALEKLS